MISDKTLGDIESWGHTIPSIWAAHSGTGRMILDLVAEVRRLRGQCDDVLKHLRYVSMIAKRLGPGISEVHRAEALALLDGTLEAAEETWKRCSEK